MIRNYENSDAGIDGRRFGPRPDDRHQGPRPDDRHQGLREDNKHFGPKEKQILIELLNYDQIDQILFSKELNIIPPESLPIFRKLDERNLISHKHEMENNKIFIFLTPEGIEEANILKEEMKNISNEFFKYLNEAQLKEFDDIFDILIVNT